MKSKLKNKHITLRISEETYEKLLKAEKELKQPVSTIVRQFIETMLLNLDKSKNQIVSNSIDAVFEILEMDNKIISKYEKSVYNLQNQLSETIEAMNEANELRMINRRNLFSGIEQ